MPEQTINPITAVCEETGRSAAGGETPGGRDDFLQQRILPGVLFLLNSRLVESPTSDVSRRDFNEGLALTITNEVIQVIKNTKMSLCDGRPCPVSEGEDTVKEEEAAEEMQREASEEMEEEDAWYEFLENWSPELRQGRTVQNVLDCSSCCPGLSRVSAAIKNRMRRMFRRAAQFFNRRTAPAPFAPPHLPQQGASDTSESLSTASFPSMDIIPAFRQSRILRINNMAGGDPSVEGEAPNNSLLRAMEPFTEESVKRFLQEVLDFMASRGRRASVDEMYDHLMSMVGSLERLREMAERPSMELHDIITEATIRTTFNVPPNALVIWGCPEGPLPYPEIPESWEREPVVEAENEPTRRTRLRWPFRFPRIRFSQFFRRRRQ
ncbi:uncharacterized protein [Hoplias malabaricus]|uniref:uncharacterized protein n=1 Tax=Hoplias malabaricus TaxID=27720 RepID=UPI0034625144